MPKRYATKLDRLAVGITQTESGCWEFHPTNVQGYGSMGSGIPGRHLLAHRAMWEYCCGPIPGGVCILHSCDNRACVRPDHLFPGTLDDNNKDRANKNRTVNGNALKSHCKRGHELTGDNLRIDRNGGRRCRVCASLFHANDSRRIAVWVGR